MNGDHIKSLANKVYNTPVALYSEENIAETLSAQAEVLAGGVLGSVLSPKKLFFGLLNVNNLLDYFFPELILRKMKRLTMLPTVKC